MPKPLVLIVGKPNVGKSTLFNRMIGEKKAIVLDFPGVTRDHLYGEARWNERAFTLIDTCGIFETPEGFIEKKQKKLIFDTINEASLVIFLTDGKNGLTSEDLHVAHMLRKSKSEIILVANKAENYDKYELEIEPEMYKLGYGKPIPLSAEHNKNIDELMFDIVDRLENKNCFKEDDNEIDDSIKVAIVGKPNAGKSSIFNCLIGMNKAIVSEIPGTTRDIVDEKIKINNISYTFIDTAGIRKKKNVKYGSIEMYSIIRTIKAIERSDVVLFILDIIEGITSQDKKVAGIAENRGKSTVILFNKIDLLENISKIEKEKFMDYFKKELFFIDYSPVIFTSAIKGYGTKEIFDNIKIANDSRNKTISTSFLNTALERYVMTNPPPIKKGKRIKFYFAHQVGTKPPVFTFQTNSPGEIPASYLQGIRNMIRKYIDPFIGSPIFLKIEDRKDKK